jgi:hypothetical protein
MRYHPDEERGTGRTTKQLEQAPLGALFIWSNPHIEYPTRIARSLNRLDITIIGSNILERPEQLSGLMFTALVLDHGLMLKTLEQSYALDLIRARCRIPQQ